jgi:ATP-binding cassette subfamily B protein
MSEGWESGGRNARGGVDVSSLPSVSANDVPLRRILALFAPQRARLIVVIVLSLVAAGIALIPPLAMKRIIDDALPARDARQLALYVLVMLAAPLLAGLVGVAHHQLNHHVGQAVMRDLRLALFQSVQRQSVAFFTKTPAGDLVQRLTGDVHFVQGVVTGSVVDGAAQLITLLATATILFVLDWRLALVSVVLVPLCALPLRIVNQRRRQIRLDTQRARSHMASLSTEAFGVSGALLTRIFAREPLVEARFAEVNQRVMDLELRFNLIARWFALLTSILGPAGTAVLFLYGGLRVIDGDMTIGALFAFAAYLAQLLGPAARLLNLHVEIAAAAAIFVRLFEVLDLKPALADRPGAVELARIDGRITLRDVSFAYGDDQARVLDGVSLEVPPGAVVALVGPSGGGKSTLASLLARLADPIEGTVAIDGVNLRDVTLASLRRQMAFVPQDSFLFHTTLAENLRFGKPDATVDEMLDACRRARIDGVVARLPAGLETVVGERGHRFSGGERQRIAIARALLADPRVLVLDEATAHLDAESEHAVREAIAELMKGRTTVVIAHRLSTVVDADEIVVLERGRMVERGRHAALLEANGLYARLFRTQLAEDVTL